MSDGGELAAALGRLLADHGWGDPRVAVDGTASGGAQRETWFVTLRGVHPSGEDWGDGRRAVAQVSNSVVSDSLASAEAALLRLASDAGVVVPEVLASTDSLPGADAPAMLMTHVGGLSIPRQVLRSLEGRDRDALVRQCGESLARLHGIPAGAAPDGLDRPVGDVYAEYCDALAEGLDELPDPHPAIRLGINWLRRHRPQRTPTLAIVHGDFRTGNLLVDDGSLAAVLDWELAHVGDPMEDLAYFCLRTWRFGADDRPAGGMGSLDALRSGYTAAGGTWDDEAFDWWTVARTAWWATGLAAQAAAFTWGLTDSIVLAASGRRVVELEYDLLRLIG